MSEMAISARDQLIAKLQEKLGASEQALAGMADDLDAKTQLVDLLQVQLREMAAETSTKDSVIDSLNVKTARLYEELDRANTDLRTSREELSTVGGLLDRKTSQLARSQANSRCGTPTTAAQPGPSGVSEMGGLRVTTMELNSQDEDDPSSHNYTTRISDCSDEAWSQHEGADAEQAAYIRVAEAMVKAPVEVAIAPSPQWQGQLDSFFAETGQWQKCDDEICNQVSNYNQLTSGHFGAGQQLAAAINNCVNHSSLAKCDVLKGTCERLAEVFDRVKDENEMMVSSFAAIWDKSCAATGATAIKHHGQIVQSTKVAMQAELRAYLDSFSKKDKDSDAGQMQVSDVIDQKREGWRSVEDATMAYHQATMELTQLVGTVSHQHNKIVLERLCSTVSALAGFHCMVGEMMKSLLPAVGDFKLALAHARATQDELAATSERWSQNALRNVSSEFAMERQYSIEHQGDGPNEVEQYIQSNPIDDKEKAGFVFQDIYYGKKNHAKWMLVWLVLKSGTLWVVPSDSKASNKKARTPKGKDRNGNAMAVATVKLPRDLPFAFEIVTPHNKMMFQPFGSLAQAKWVACCRNAIADQLYGGESRRGEAAAEAASQQLELLLAADGNTQCSDCGGVTGMDWISINLGIMFCIECSGIHRSLGAHLSKVRGLRLDTLSEDTTQSLCSVGNTKANALWEARLDELGGTAVNLPSKPSSDSGREAKEKYASAKYKDRAYLPLHLAGMFDHRSATREALFEAVREDDTATLSVILALTGGDAGTIWEGTDLCKTGSTARHTTLLHAACSHGSLNSAILLKNAGAQMSALDSLGKSSLDCAEAEGHAKMCRWMFENLPNRPGTKADSDGDSDDERRESEDLSNTLRERAFAVFGISHEGNMNSSDEDPEDELADMPSCLMDDDDDDDVWNSTNERDNDTDDDTDVWNSTPSTSISPSRKR